MAEERFITPEKQLLKLIEDPKTNTATIHAQAIKHHSLSLFSFGAWVGRISFFREAFKKWLCTVRTCPLDIKLINRALGLLIFVLTVYFIINLFNSLSNFKKMPSYLEFKPQEGPTFAATQQPSFLKKAVSYYFEKIRERDIFKMGPKKSTAVEGSHKGPSVKITEATQHLKLVGISWSNDPDAMIEDTKALRTCFVKRGQMIGDVKVQAIFKDKVVLTYAGEEIELR